VSVGPRAALLADLTRALGVPLRTISGSAGRDEPAELVPHGGKRSSPAVARQTAAWREERPPGSLAMRGVSGEAPAKASTEGRVA